MTSHMETRRWAIASFCSPSLASVERQASALWLSSSALWFCRHWTPSLPAVKTQEAVIRLSFHQSSESAAQYDGCWLNVDLGAQSAVAWKLLMALLWSHSLYAAPPPCQLHCLGESKPVQRHSRAAARFAAGQDDDTLQGGNQRIWWRRLRIE